jgi:hypothetical protein
MLPASAPRGEVIGTCTTCRRSACAHLWESERPGSCSSMAAARPLAPVAARARAPPPPACRVPAGRPQSARPAGGCRHQSGRLPSHAGARAAPHGGWPPAQRQTPPGLRSTQAARELGSWPRWCGHRRQSCEQRGGFRLGQLKRMWGRGKSASRSVRVLRRSSALDFGALYSQSDHTEEPFVRQGTVRAVACGPQDFDGARRHLCFLCAALSLGSSLCSLTYWSMLPRVSRE